MFCEKLKCYLVVKWRRRRLRRRTGNSTFQLSRFATQSLLAGLYCTVNIVIFSNLNITWGMLSLYQLSFRNLFDWSTYFLRLTQLISNHYHRIWLHFNVTKSKMPQIIVPSNCYDQNQSLTKQTPRCGAFSWDVSIWSVGMYRFIHQYSIVARVVISFYLNLEKNRYH